MLFIDMQKLLANTQKILIKIKNIRIIIARKYWELNILHGLECLRSYLKAVLNGF